ncbi:MAG: DNA translocase FtsK [Flavisolibacter sp.]
MNFFKRIFKANDTKETLNSLANINISSNEKIEEPTVQESDQSKENTETRKLTEEEKSKLIERFARDGDSFDNNNIDGFDPLLEDAARLIVQSQSGSAAFLQRRMKLGYNRAGRLMDQLEQIGIVGPNLGSKLRDVLIKTDAEFEHYLENDFKFYKTEMPIFYETHRIEIEEKRQKFQEEQRQQQIQHEKNLIKREFLEKERKKQLQREVYKELLDEGVISNQSTDKDWSREPIPQDIMDKVWNRDGGRCVKCGSQENLEFDHIIPFSKGGANTYRNLQILCKKCNVEKSNKIG